MFSLNNINVNSVQDVKQVPSRKHILKCSVKYINSVHDLKQVPSWKHILKCSVKYIISQGLWRMANSS